MKRNGLLSAVFLLAFIPLLAQNNDIRVKEAKGEWTISNITPEQAYEKALTEAKFAALRIAGVEESVNAINSLFTTEKGQEYTDISNVELGGDVIDFTVKERKIEYSRSANGQEVLVAKVTIDAIVRKYAKKRDASFLIKVDGVKLLYQEGDKMTFTFTPSKEGYLKIFWFENDQQGFLLYPNANERSRIFDAKKQILFPLTPGFDYRVEKSNSNAPIEKNLLFFVYTKNDIPFFDKEVDYYALLSWLAKISPDERVEFKTIFQISK